MAVRPTGLPLFKKKPPQTRFSPGGRRTAQRSIRGVVSVLVVLQINDIANMAATTITDMNVTKSRATCMVVLILLSTVAMIAGAQSSTQDQSSAQETLV